MNVAAVKKLSENQKTQNKTKQNRQFKTGAGFERGGTTEEILT